MFKCGATTFQHGYTVVEARSVANISVEELDALGNHAGVGLMALHFMYGSKTDGLGVSSFLKELAKQLGPSKDFERLVGVTNECASRMLSQAVSFAINEGSLKPYYPVLNSFLHMVSASDCESFMVELLKELTAQIVTDPARAVARLTKWCESPSRRLNEVYAFATRGVSRLISKNSIPSGHFDASHTLLAADCSPADACKALGEDRHLVLAPCRRTHS